MTQFELLLSALARERVASSPRVIAELEALREERERTP